MFTRQKLSYAVAATMGSALVASSASAAIEEIIVTASKRAESAQDVPISVQALGGDSLRDLKIETFDKYVDFLPNVVSAGNGPGKKEVYIRGSAGEQSSVNVGPAQGSAPGVALYLDEQPVSFGSRNLDIYAVDMERIEVLAGPQGTLFGASSQSGTVRLITNKPKQGKFEGGYNAKQSFTDGGADSTAVDAYLNLPLNEKLAARVAIYSDNQGGYIDNVRSTFVPNGEVVDRNKLLGFGPDIEGADPDLIESADNQLLVEDDWNRAQYRGARFGLAYDINDDWNIVVQHTQQTLETTGTFLSDPSLGDYSSAKFAAERNRDDFGLTTWTIEGRVANLDVIYTGGTINRDIDLVIDYTHYNNGGGYISYYLCGGDPLRCFDPTKQFTDVSTNDRTTHEFRIQSDAENRFRFIAGAYFNSFETTHVGEFQYLGTQEVFNLVAGDTYLIANTSIDTVGTVTSEPRGTNTVFFNDFTRTEDEFALFGELAFDFSEKITARISTRYYDLDTQLQGASNFSFGCRFGNGGDNSVVASNGGCNGDGYSNDVTQRLLLLGQANASGDYSGILAARAPSAARGGADRELFRGGCGKLCTGSQQRLVDDIESGAFDISNIEADGSTNESDIIIKATVDYKINEDNLLFATYSEGYRPATQNRNAGRLAARQLELGADNADGDEITQADLDANPYQGYRVPAVALTDTLTNFEVGYKGDISDSLRFNATVYFSQIENLQVSRFDPSNVAFLVFIENVGDADIFGVDADFQWAVTDNLTLTGAFSILDTELTRINDQLDSVAVPVGSELPLAPNFAGNLRARYDFELAAFDADAYLMASVNYRAESLAGIAGSAAFFENTQQLAYGRERPSGLEIRSEGGNFVSATVETPNTRYVNPSAVTVNLAAGVEKDGWGAEFFVDNLTNEEATIVQVAGKFTPEVTNQRPLTVGLRLSYFFE